MRKEAVTREQSQGQNQNHAFLSDPAVASVRMLPCAGSLATAVHWLYLPFRWRKARYLPPLLSPATERLKLSKSHQGCCDMNWTAALRSSLGFSSGLKPMISHNVE